MGAEGAMSPGRVHDPAGAKIIVLSYKTVAGAVASVIKHRFVITCFTEAETGRLRLDPVLTTGRTTGAQPGAKKILIYDATPHSISDLNPPKYGPGTTPRDRQQWAIHMLKQVEELPDVEQASTYQDGAANIMDTAQQVTRNRQDPGGRNTATPEQAWQQHHGRNSGKAPARPHILQGRQSEGATSQERRA